MIGIRSEGNPNLRFCIVFLCFSSGGSFSGNTIGIFLVKTAFTIHKKITKIMPGPIVARKHASTDGLLAHAYRICAELGGISSPRGQAAARSEAVYPFSYPAAVIRGSIIEPIHDKVADAEP